MQSVANTEPKVHIDRAIWQNCAHAATYLYFLISWQYCIIIHVTFEVDTVAVEADLCPRQLRQSLTFPILGTSWINPESHIRI